MPETNTDLQQEMLNTLYEQVYSQLDAKTGLYQSCPTRVMSWDEAAAEARSMAEDSAHEADKKMYNAAADIYQEAVTVWDAINDSRNLF